MIISASDTIFFAAEKTSRSPMSSIIGVPPLQRNIDQRMFAV